MTPGARQAGRAVAATAGACLLVTLVGWAALVGPSPVLTGRGPVMSTETTSTTLAPVEELPDQEFGPAEQDADGIAARIGQAVGLALTVVVAVAMVLVVLLVGRRAVTLWRLRRRYEPPPFADFETVETSDAQQARRSMATDEREQLRVLLDGAPRNAIVACWHRFELQAVEAGLVRHAWETSSELALRLLERAEVDPVAVTRLLELYREARFSEHDLGEDAREAAVAALRRIQSGVVNR